MAATGAAPRRFRCYTKTGDKGFSSLYNGERRPKDDLVFQALGDVDELNSAIGLASEYCREEGLEDLCSQLATIQSRLLDVGSAVATPVSKSSAAKLRRVQFEADSVDMLESWLDSMDDQLPPLSNFILPSGGLAASHLHVARSTCRRAERAVVGLSLSSTSSSPQDEGAAAANGHAASLSTGDAEGESQESGSVMEIEPVVVRYMNRLSDYLFTAARYAALKAGREETVYKKI